jgi:hypothetical protein
MVDIKNDEDLLELLDDNWIEARLSAIDALNSIY